MLCTALIAFHDFELVLFLVIHFFGKIISNLAATDYHNFTERGFYKIDFCQKITERCGICGEINSVSNGKNCVSGGNKNLVTPLHSANENLGFDFFADGEFIFVKKAEKSLDSREQEDDVKYELPRPLEIGDYVHVVDANCGGYVLRLPNSSGTLTVDINGMKMSVNVGRIRLVDAPKAKKPQSTVRRTVTRTNTGSKTEIDLRGRTAEEGIMELDCFIDSAMLSGMNFVHCIHGKGTGVLRQSVQAHLRTHKAIKSYRLGTFGEGENGVTIVTLK